jgi:hypothetical protein
MSDKSKTWLIDMTRNQAKVQLGLTPHGELFGGPNEQSRSSGYLHGFLRRTNSRRESSVGLKWDDVRA